MQSEERAFIKPETDAAAMVAAAHARATRERARLNILGLAAAFGRFAFPTPKDRTQRHADTWRDKGPHENTGAAARRMRQMERQREKAIRKQMAIG